MVTFQEALNCQMNTPQEHTDPQTAHIHARLGEHAGPAVPNLIMSLRDREEEVRAAARVWVLEHSISHSTGEVSPGQNASVSILQTGKWMYMNVHECKWM